MKRRTYLRALGVGALAGLAGCSSSDGEPTAQTPTATPEDTPEGTPDTGPDGGRGTTEIPFDTTVDMVEDLGCDPTGEESCTDALREAAAHNTRLRFPAGEFALGRTARLAGYDNLSVVGAGVEETTLVAPPDHNGNWLVFDEGSAAGVAGFTVDASARDTAPTVKVAARDRILVRDVEVVGRGSYPGGAAQNVGNALLPVVRSAQGAGLVQNFVAREGGVVGRYNNGHGRVGIYVGPSIRGSLRFVDCHLEEFPNNGIYASRTPGRIMVEGGLFRNNDAANVRLSGDGSYVDGTRIEVDAGAYEGPGGREAFNNPRAIAWDSGSFPKAGGEIRNCRIAFRDAPTVVAAVVVKANTGALTFRNSHLTMDVNRPALLAMRPNGGYHAAPPEPHNVHIHGARIDGQTTGPGILISGRPGSRLANSLLALPNAVGIRLADAPDFSLSDTLLFVGQEAVVDPSATFDVQWSLPW